MDIDRYFDVSDDQIVFSRQQSSDFAKRIAGDFNPLHDVDSKRFCVPGDLLFAVYLHRHGIYESMTFDFLNMVDATAPLSEQHREDHAVLVDAKDREYLTVGTSGQQSAVRSMIDGLTQGYVQFSGQTFPYLLVDLMREHQVMINPSRPLVIYKSMQLTMSSLEGEDISLRFSGSELIPDGKKATVDLNFDIYAQTRLIGHGQKKMLLGGLRSFDEQAMANLVSEYQKIKSDYSQTTSH